MRTFQGLYAWHVHHEDLVELLVGPLQNRTKYIKRAKPRREVDVRLRLLKVVKDQKAIELPMQAFILSKSLARDAYQESMMNGYNAYKSHQSGPNHQAAYTTYEGVIRSSRETYHRQVRTAKQILYKALKTLHDIECPNCPWNGKTIFPKEKKDCI